MRKTLFFSGILLCLMACSHVNDEFIHEFFNTPQTSGNSLKYTFDEALDNMYKFLDGAEDGKTRSMKRYATAEFYVIGNPNPSTRSQNNNDSLFYLVNFADNEGFAILAADKRLDEVIAIGDRGSAFPYKHFVNFSQENKNNLDGQDSFNSFLAGLLLDYADRNLVEYETATRADGPGPDPGTDPGPDPGTDPEEWITKHKVFPFIGTKWNQLSPYSDVYMEENGLEVGDRNWQIGCVSIAVGQMCAYLRHPSTFVTNGEELIFDMDEINSVGRWNPTKGGLEYGTVQARSNTSRYLYEIYKLLFSQTHNDVYNFFSRSGFDLRSYNEFGIPKDGEEPDILKFYPIIEEALLDRIPVFFTSMRGSAHAWVLDGVWSRYKWYKDENNTSKKSEQNLVHCNFGWEGISDGYYIFKLFNRRIEYLPEYGDWVESNRYFSLFTSIIPRPK